MSGTSPPTIPSAPTKDVTSAALARESRVMLDAIGAISGRLQALEASPQGNPQGGARADNGSGNDVGELCGLLRQLISRMDNGNGGDNGDGASDAATGEEGVSSSAQTNEEEKGHNTEGSGGATYDNTRARRLAADAQRRADSVAAALEDDAVLGAAQHRYDQILSLHGRRADRPRIAERSSVYRRRVLRQLCDLSPRHKGINPHLVSDPKAFDELEAAILEGARKEAYNEATVAPGVLREIRERDQRTGREIIKFVGSFRTAMEPFLAPVYKVRRINRRPDEV
jgi:hypothetical protein